MRRFYNREVVGFLTIFIACGAFLVGAVKIWGVPADRVLSGLLMAVLMLGGLILLALALVVIVKKINRRKDD